MALYRKDFEQRSNNAYLPPFIAGYVEESFQQTVTVTVTERATETDREMERETETEKNSGNGENDKELENLFWISVSGYQLERVGLVYRFFLDIGQIVDKIFTESNLMYLKYLCVPDCEIALSYDGQKIGYGGDILVRVKPENPMLEMKLVSKAATVAAIDDNSTSTASLSSSCVIEVEAETKSPVNSIVVLDQPIRRVPKTGFLQWLKQKVSYMFYYY